MRGGGWGSLPVIPMPASHDIKKIVSLVVQGLRRSDPEPTIIQNLIAAGIPKADAPELFSRVKLACQQGVQAYVTQGQPAPPADPLLAQAYRACYESMSGAVHSVWLRRGIFAAAVVLAIAGIVWLLRQ